MEWTKTPPSEAGWYWVYHHEFKRPIITEFYDDGTCIVDVFQRRIASGVYWQGPLEVPETPKID